MFDGCMGPPSVLLHVEAPSSSNEGITFKSDVGCDQGLYKEHGLVNEDSVWIAGSPMSSMHACSGTTFSTSLFPDLNKILGVMDKGTEDSS